MKTVMNIASAVISFALPPRCPGCGMIVREDSSFCTACWQSLDFLPETGCAHCALPMVTSDLTCARCLSSPPSHDRVLAAVSYGEIAKSIILKLKHGRRIGLARTVGHFLRPKLACYPGAMLIPVPLHRRRLWSRGFNQSVLIARTLSRDVNMELNLDILWRRISTPMLGGLGARDRSKALRGAFALRDGANKVCKGRTIILIDDVYTSGATTNACAKLLKRAGAAHVHIVCWARVLQTAEDAY
jgi:ComF family protein